MDRVTWTDDAQPRELTLGKLLYNLRTDTSGDPDLLMDAVTMDDLMQDPDIEQILMLDALVVEVGMMQRKMEQLMAVMTAAGKTAQPTGMEIGEPVRSRGVVQVPVLFPMSDGQTVAVWFHNPDATPAKLTPMDMLTSWRWMVNKKDVTIAAAPERGADLQPRIVARRIMAIVEKNSPAFTRANAKAAEKAGQIEVLKGEVGALEVRKAGLKRDVEIAREESLARGMAKATKAAKPAAAAPVAEGFSEFIAAGYQWVERAGWFSKKFELPDNAYVMASIAKTQGGWKLTAEVQTGGPSAYVPMDGGVFKTPAEAMSAADGFVAELADDEAGVDGQSAPAPAAGLTAAQRKKISDEIARTEAMLAKEYKISTDLQKPVAIGWYESHIANLSDVLNGRMSLAEIDASEREKIEDWDTTRAVFEARAAGATGAEPAAAAPAPEQPSTQFQNYANWLRKQAAEGKAVPETFWQQVAMDERLNDGEADALKAEHAAPAAPPASDPITEPPAADLFGEAPQAFQTQPVALAPAAAAPPASKPGPAKQAKPGKTRFVTKNDIVGSSVEWQENAADGSWVRITTFSDMAAAKAAVESQGYDAEGIPRFVSEFSVSAKRFLPATPETLTPEGAESKVKTAKGTEVLTGYSVVEADHLITSHNPSTGDANPAFPAELQPRDRGRDASIAWVKKTAQNLDPDLLGKSRRADSGAPIVGPDGVVESSNGRTMAVVLAYQSGKADDYRAWLEEEAGYFGLKPEKVKAMKRPVLVRIRTSKVDRAAFAIEANQSDTLAMTATEKAKSDARRMDDNMIALMTENGDLAAAENVPFLSAFLRSLGESEAAQYSTTDGKPTSTLIARVQAAIFAKAYQDDRLLELTADVAKPEIANIVKALNHAAPEFIQAAAMDPEAAGAATGKLTDAVEKSLNQKAVDALLGASNVIRQAKDAGQSVEEFVQQSGLFGDIDPDVAAMAVFIAKNNRSAKRMGEAFKAMATFIKGEIQRRQTGDMFGDNEPVAFADIVAAANRELERMYGPGVETIGLFDRPAAVEPVEPAAPAAEPAAAVADPSPEPDFDPVAAVNAAYTFDKATDDFKAELAQSLDDEDYSPFATAREFDQAVKSHGGTVSWALVPGAILDSAAAHGADDWGDVSGEWDDAAGELVTDGVLILDGDFAGHPFRGNQHRRAKMQTHHAARASREAKRADRRAAGHDRVLQYAHSSAAHAHKQAAKGATGKTKAYHARMAAFHAKRAKHHEDKVDGKPVMDSVSADLLLDSAWPDADMVILDGVGGDIQGVIRKGARILGRAVIGNDGKGMVYTGSKGSTRVTNPSGARAIWGEYPSVMVEGLFGAAPAPKKPTVKSKPMDEPMNQTTAPESATAPAIDTDRAYLQAIIANEIAVTDDVMARVEAMAATHASHAEMMALIEKAVDVIQAIVIAQAQSAMGGKG